MSDTLPQIDEQIIAFIKGELDAAGKSSLEQWVTASPQNRDYFSKTCQVWLATGIEAYRDSFNADDAFSEFKMNHGGALKRAGARWRVFTTVAAAAAASSLSCFFIVRSF